MTVWDDIAAAFEGARETVLEFAAPLALLGGAPVQESELVDVDKVTMGPLGFDGRHTVVMHPITARMIRTGEDRTTATIGWTIDRATDRALRRHEARCDAADKRAETRWLTAWNRHAFVVELMRSRWRVADLMGVPYPVVADVSDRDYRAPGVEMTL